MQFLWSIMHEKKFSSFQLKVTGKFFSCINSPKQPYRQKECFSTLFTRHLCHGQLQNLDPGCHLWPEFPVCLSGVMFHNLP